MRHVALAVALLACACGAEEPSEESGPFPQLELVDHDDWTVSDAAADPLAAHRPNPVECLDSEWFAEGPGLEVETGACNYLMVEQPTISDIDAGSEVHISIAHFDLMAASPAEAHVAIVLDGAVIWDATEAIPSPAAPLSGDWSADADYPAGTRIQFHLHNHGYNSWQLYGLTVDDR
jgi:hypothetical protein